MKKEKRVLCYKNPLVCFVIILVMGALMLVVGLIAYLFAWLAMVWNVCKIECLKCKDDQFYVSEQHRKTWEWLVTAEPKKVK